MKNWNDNSWNVTKRRLTDSCMQQLQTFTMTRSIVMKRVLTVVIMKAVLCGRSRGDETALLRQTVLRCTSEETNFFTILFLFAITTVNVYRERSSDLIKNIAFNVREKKNSGKSVSEFSSVPPQSITWECLLFILVSMKEGIYIFKYEGRFCRYDRCTFQYKVRWNNTTNPHTSLILNNISDKMVNVNINSRHVLQTLSGKMTT